MSRPSSFKLWRRLFGLVYRDAARLHGVGAAVVILPFVYLWREWPPWLVRATVLAMPAPQQAIVALGAIVVHARVGAAPVRTLLSSQRLALFRTLPVSRGFWRRTHALHLLLLDAPWFAVLAYAVATRPAVPAVLAWISAAGLTVALQVGALALADRPRLSLGAASGAIALVALTWLVPSASAAAVLGLGLLGAAYVRLGEPLPEPSVAVHRLPGSRGPARAWARLLLLVWLRRAPLLAAATLGVQVLGVAAIVLARMHVGDRDPVGIALLSRFVAVLGAWAGASALLQAVRGLDRDRAWLDALPLSLRDEHRARIGIALVAAAPTWVGLAFVSPRPLEGLFAAVWAAAAMASLVAGRERARALHRRLVERLVLTGFVALVLALGIGHTIVLVPWAAWATPKARRRLLDATLVRARFETPRENDDHG